MLKLVRVVFVQNPLNALDTGHFHVSKLINERFVVPEGNTASSKSLNEPLPKSNIKTLKS